MALVTYTVMRNLPAEDEQGRACKIAVALVQHENGTLQRVAINEEMIRFLGEGIIEGEIRQAVQLPPDGSIVRQRN